jgi:hypothetical protein
MNTTCIEKFGDANNGAMLTSSSKMCSTTPRLGDLRRLKTRRPFPDWRTIQRSWAMGQTNRTGCSSTSFVNLRRIPDRLRVWISINKFPRTMSTVYPSTGTSTKSPGRAYQCLRAACSDFSFKVPMEFGKSLLLRKKGSRFKVQRSSLKHTAAIVTFSCSIGCAALELAAFGNEHPQGRKKIWAISRRYAQKGLF